MEFKDEVYVVTQKRQIKCRMQINFFFWERGVGSYFQCPTLKRLIIMENALDLKSFELL